MNPKCPLIHCVMIMCSTIRDMKSLIRVPVNNPQECRLTGKIRIRGSKVEEFNTNFKTDQSELLIFKGGAFTALLEVLHIGQPD